MMSLRAFKLRVVILLCASSPGVVEGLHYAAYKNALCNSLYCPDHMVGNIQSDHVGVSPTAKTVKLI